MILPNDDEKLLDYFAALPKRNLDSEAKQRILQELKLAEHSMKRSRKRTLWAGGMATVSMLTAASFLIYFFGGFQGLGIKISGSEVSSKQQGTMTTNTQNSSSSADSNPLSTQNQAIAAQIKDILNSAKVGKVANVEYAAGSSSIDTVEQKWGKADTTERADNGLQYATYTKHNVAFGFNPLNQIVDVRSFDPGLKRISSVEVVSALGTPGDIRYYQGQEIIVYNASPNIELEWVFSALSKQNPNPNLDHISVYYANATKSNTQ
jgi:Domain of unknown function (DUF4309)